MTGLAIKICGIDSAAALDAAISARADFVGLNFYPPSPRFRSSAEAAALAARAAGRVTMIGVFVDPDDALLRDAIAAGRLDAVQLHRVSAARRAEVRARFRLPVWAVVEVAQRSDLAARHHLDAADRVLYDAKTPAGALPGGIGLAFDWSMLAGLVHPLPWGLAGGLSPTNVAEAVRTTGTPLVDTSSGVESAPGIKDPAKIAAFCAAGRAA